MRFGDSPGLRIITASLQRLLILTTSVVVMSASGCLTRQAAPGLPYVQPAQSAGISDASTVSAHLTARMQDLEQELQKLRDQIERQQTAGANESELRQLQDRVAFIEKQLGIESRTPLPQPQPPASSAVPRAQVASEVAPKNGKPASNLSLPSQQPPLELVNPPQTTEEQSYREAYAAYKAGDFDQAVKLFEAFLAKFPKSDLAQNAVYWMGEARFAQGRFDEAVLQFDRVIKEFPGSKKELNSLLRQGQAFEKMGDNRSARIIFQKLVTDYPHSAQARIASSRLKNLPVSN